MTSAYELGKVPVLTFPQRVRIAREHADLEQSELADRMGVSRSTISNTERGKSVPQRVVVNAWALATGVPVSWLINGETPAGPDGPDGVAECARRYSKPQPSVRCITLGESSQVTPFKPPNSKPAVEPVRPLRRAA